MDRVAGNQSDRKRLRTSNNKLDAIPLVPWQSSIRPDSQGDILFAFIAIDAQNDAAMFPYQTSSLLASAHALCGPYVDTGVHDLEVLRPGQARPGTRDHAPRELAVDSDRVGEAHAAPLEGVEGQAVELLQPPIPALDEVEVGEVAVEQDGRPRL